MTPSPGTTSAQAAAERRTRLRRASAFGGMLVVVGGLVTVRAVLQPAPSQALSTSGLAAAVNGSGPSARHTHASGARHRQVLTGQPYDVGYGIVQVKVTVVGGRITDVQPLAMPQGGRSSDISSYAAPQLRSEVLSAQSARIDSVSGATYTSAGYAQSLQSALDKRGS